MSTVAGSENQSHSFLANAEPTQVRGSIRQNQYSGHTAGLCDGLLQCNLVILPQELATDFQRFCEENTVFCPLLGKSAVGEYGINALGPNIDLRTDLPLYNIYENGKLARTQTDVKAIWRDDFVAFAIGCSFTFERALLSAGISMRHIEQNLTVPMYKTSLQTKQFGAFGGSAVVSMRPIKAPDIKRVIEICEHYPHAHGAPIHVGYPADIGISDIDKPEWGSAVSIAENELPVFWGCGVTSQVSIINAAPPICITHAPGAMLITEIDELSNSDWRDAGPLDE